MIKCEKCKELITTSAPCYKASRGFLDNDGYFHEDASITMHMECYYHYTVEPFSEIERIKES